MLKQDYLLRQVESLAMSLSKLFFNKDMVQYKLEEKDNLSDTDILYSKLGKLVSEGKIEYLRVGIDFYTNLNRLEDKVLEAHNYSREEIEQGLHDLSSEYGINLS